VSEQVDAGEEAGTATQGEAGATMEIHKPKAAHSWREFLIEIATIVLGILIALGLEQGIEAFHEHQLAREAREAIDAEMREDMSRIAYRLTQQPCIDRRLDQITGLLIAWNKGSAPPAELDIGRPDDLPLIDQRWQANLNSGRFNQQSSAEQAEQAGFYTQVTIFNDVLHHEHEVWSQLRTLDLGPGMLSADTRPALVAALASARTDAYDVGELGRLMQARFARKGAPPRPYSEATIRSDTCQPLRKNESSPAQVREGN
jgi:hypothetical protein